MPNYPKEYLQFLAHFHGDRDFFECHELLEEHWKKEPADSRLEIWVSLIQAAVGMYHYRRGNAAGAVKSLEGALKRSDRSEIEHLGIDADAWIAMLEDAVRAVKAGEPYRDRDIPLQDEALADQARRLCEELTGSAWGAPSRMDDEEIVHRHATRDRTEVIETRRKALAERRGGRRR